MASGTAPPVEGVPETPKRARDTQSEAFIDDRLRQTRRQVKWVDIVGGLILLGIGVLAYLLTAAMVDHWLVPGGLGVLGRWMWFVGLIAAASCYFIYRILPPLVKRINPIFAAHTIEQSRPSLKNSLINFLLLRGHRREVSGVVYRAIEDRAAVDLSQVELEVAVDRTHVIRLGYVLAAVFAIGCLYLVLSPKNPLISAARIIWPWTDTLAPTRVTIEEIEPGHTVEFRTEHVAVRAKVGGLKEGEVVLLYYTTDDAQTIDQAVPMTRPKDGRRYQCELPPGELGLQQDLEYYLKAGDCTSETFTIKVQVAPTILVDQIEYDYPEYTEIPDRTVPRQGDVRAIEGTKVKIHATANQEIASAAIDLNCDGQRQLKMDVDDHAAKGHFTLRLSEDDPTRAEYDSYQLRFTDHAGNSNRRPIRHWIDVTADLPPEIELLAPQQEEVQLPEDGELEIRVRAEDPDFALRRVVLHGEHAGRALSIPPLLDKLYEGEFEAAYAFEPTRLGLKAGDRVLYWAVAEDNKQPQSGRSETQQQWITIVGPERAPTPQEQPGDSQQGQPQDSQDSPNRPSDEPPDPSQPTEPKPQEDQPPSPDEEPSPGDTPQEPPEEPNEQQDLADEQQGEQEDEATSSPEESGDSPADRTEPGEEQPSESEQSREPIDSQTQDGDAFEEILEDRQQQQQAEQPPEEQQPEEQQPEDQPQGDQPQGSKQPEGQPQGNEQSGGKQQTDQPQGDQPQGDGQQNDQPSADRPQAGTQEGTEQSGGEQQGTPQPGDQPQDGQQQRDRQQGGAQQGDPQPGDNQGGDRQESGDQRPPDEQPGDPRQGGETQRNQPRSPGPGKPTTDESGSPMPQEQDLPREKKPGPEGSEPGEKPEKADSPSTSPKQSDSQGEPSGDRSGGGKKGGGQEANQEGTGSAGANTEADEGGAPAPSKGQGETGKRGGEQVESEQPTGRSARREGTSNSGKGQSQPAGQRPGEKPSRRSDSSEGGTPQTDPRHGGQAGDQTSDGAAAHGQGPPTTGGREGVGRDGTPPPEIKEPGGDDPNLEYARSQTDLALEHLKDQMKQEQSPLLERLGWSREEARRFIEKWEEMKRAAAGRGSQSKAARKSLEDAIRSLGLRGRGTELRGGGLRSDELEELREGAHMPAPPEWSERMRLYNKGTAGSR